MICISRLTENFLDEHNEENIMWCGVMLAALSSCTEEDYKVYDTSQKDSVFFEYRDDANKLIEAIEYNFNYDIADSHTIEIPVSLMGMPKDYDRTYNIVVIDDETDMVEDVNYVISDNVIKARAVNGVVKVNLLRNLDPELLTTSKTLTLSISENDQLKSVGENKFAITYSDIRPEVRPVWWTPYATMPVMLSYSSITFTALYPWPIRLYITKSSTPTAIIS